MNSVTLETTSVKPSLKIKKKKKEGEYIVRAGLLESYYGSKIFFF